MINVLNIEDIEEGSSKGLEANSIYMFAVKKADQIYLYWNRCPHLRTPLEWEEDRFLEPDGALIQCATHGALFQISDGRCLAGPCKGKSLKPVPFIIESGMVMVEKHILNLPTHR